MVDYPPPRLEKTPVNSEALHRARLAKLGRRAPPSQSAELTPASSLQQSHLESLNPVQLIENKTGKRVSLKRLPMQPGDVPIAFTSIEKSRSANWLCPSYFAFGGINGFIDRYKAYHEIAKSRS